MRLRTALAGAALTTFALVLVAGTSQQPGSRQAAPAPLARAAGAPEPAPPRQADAPIPVVRRALRWLLQAEAGQARPLPARTFSPALQQALTRRPPRPSAGVAVPGRIRSLREQAPIGGARRVVAFVAHGGRREPVTLIVSCRPECLVAGVE